MRTPVPGTASILLGSPKVVGMPYVAATLLLVLGACVFTTATQWSGGRFLPAAYAVGLWRYWIWRRAARRSLDEYTCGRLTASASAGSCAAHNST